MTTDRRGFRAWPRDFFGNKRIRKCRNSEQSSPAITDLRRPIPDERFETEEIRYHLSSHLRPDDSTNSFAGDRPVPGRGDKQWSPPSSRAVSSRFFHSSELRSNLTRTRTSRNGIEEFTCTRRCRGGLVRTCRRPPRAPNLIHAPYYVFFIIFNNPRTTTRLRSKGETETRLYTTYAVVYIMYIMYTRVQPSP